MTSTRIISDQAGKRVGDCVAVEQGQFNNIRLVADSLCPATPTAAARSAVDSASACDQAKAMVLAASTDADFATAERRMRLLCGE